MGALLQHPALVQDHEPVRPLHCRTAGRTRANTKVVRSYGCPEEESKRARAEEIRESGVDWRFRINGVCVCVRDVRVRVRVCVIVCVARSRVCGWVCVRERGVGRGGGAWERRRDGGREGGREGVCVRALVPACVGVP